MPADHASAEDLKVYAEWYAWGYERWGDRCPSHAAGSAALVAKRNGCDAAGMVAAVEEAAKSIPSTALAPTSFVRIGQYGEWYQWALDNLDLDRSQAHLAAQAAQRAAEQGLLPAAAANQARRAARPTAPPPSPGVASTGSPRSRLRRRLALGLLSATAVASAVFAAGHSSF